MTDLHAVLDDYLHTRRALGTQLKWPESCLRQFVDLLIAQRTDVVTTALALRWTFQPVGLQPATYARRLGIVRAFACWLHRTTRRGSAGATVRSCSSLSRPGYATASCAPYAAVMSNSASAPMSDAWAKGARHVVRRCALTSS
jgi:hypothetical protein